MGILPEGGRMTGVEIMEFYAARLDEDESTAGHAGGHEWHTGCTCEGGVCRGYPACEQVEGDDITIYNEGGHDADQAAHIARHDPARVLREVEAGRELLTRYRETAIHLADNAATMLNGQFRAAVAAQGAQLAAIRDRAAVWSDHPDYDPVWTPEHVRA
jgi:hypothetical protein